MDASHIQTFLHRLGCEKITTSYDVVRCRCPLARWTHTGGRDQHPSFAVTIVNGGESRWNCKTCSPSVQTKDTWLFSLSTLLWRLHSLGNSKPELLMFLAHHNRWDVLKEPPISRDDLRARLDRLPAYEDVEAFEKPRVYLEDIEQPEPQASVPEAELDRFRAHMPAEVTQYLEERGLTDETVDLFELGWQPDQRRVVIPIRAEDGALVALSGRAFDEAVKPKYLHSRFKRDLVLFGENRIVKGRPCYLVEGFFQAIFMTQCGYENVLARMGTHLSSEQLRKLVTYFSGLIIVPDGDAPGRTSAVQIAAIIQPKLPTRIVEMPDGLDADRLSPWQLEKLVGPPSGGRARGEQDGGAIRSDADV